MLLTAFIVLGIVLLYTCWSVSVTSWSRLAGLGIAHEKSSMSFFDNVLSAFLIGTGISRIVWMLLNTSVYQDVPWGILPYSRSATEFVWFTVFPWRFFRLTEGVIFPVLWGIMGFLAVLFIFLPTIRLARRLRLEKRGVMRSFIMRNLFCVLATLVYFGALVYFSL